MLNNNFNNNYFILKFNVILRLTLTGNLKEKSIVDILNDPYSKYSFLNKTYVHIFNFLKFKINSFYLNEWM